MKNFILIFTFSLFSIASYSQDFWEVLPCDGGNNAGLFDMATTQQGIIFVAKFGTEGGVFRSDDNGLTWHIKNNGLIQKTIRGIAIKDSNTLYVSSSDGVHRTHDLGESWDWVYNNGIYPLEYNVIRFGYDSIILVGGGREKAILRSADDGETPFCAQQMMAKHGMLYSIFMTLIIGNILPISFLGPTMLFMHVLNLHTIGATTILKFIIQLIWVKHGTYSGILK